MSWKRHLKFRRGYVPCAECGADSWSGLCGWCKAAAQHYAKTRRAQKHRCSCSAPATHRNSDHSWSCEGCHKKEVIGYEIYTCARKTTAPSESVFAESR